MQNTKFFVYLKFHQNDIFSVDFPQSTCFGVYADERNNMDFVFVQNISRFPIMLIQNV